MKGKFQDTKKKKRWPVIAGAVLIVVLILLLVRCGKEDLGVPTLIVETPQKISLSDSGEFTLDVIISDLGDALYPAASMSICFDSSRLEFLGVEEGNVFIYDDETASGVSQQLPDWSCNTDQCNNSGLINIMYLDLTGGKYAFSRDLLAEDNNVVLRLKFRLRGSARAGDVYDLIVEDAVFAASDESQSLAMTTGTLKTKNGKVVVGE